MFRILIVSIFYFCSLLTAVADIPVNEESGFTYSLEEVKRSIKFFI